MTENEAIKEFKENIELPFGYSISNEASEIAISAIEELEQYRAIGTVDKCRKAVERQRAKQPCKFEYDNGAINYGCPVCKRKFISKINGKWRTGYFNEYCEKCGQAISWGEESEGEDD